MFKLLIAKLKFVNKGEKMYRLVVLLVVLIFVVSCGQTELKQPPVDMATDVAILEPDLPPIVFPDAASNADEDQYIFPPILDGGDCTDYG